MKVCYADESCKGDLICVAVVCFECREPPAAKCGESQTLKLLKDYNYKIKKEVKGSEFFKSKKFEQVGPHDFCKWLEEVEHGAACSKGGCTKDEKERLLLEALDELNPDINILIVDAGLTARERIKGIRVKCVSSHKSLGVQAADLVANFYRLSREGRRLC